MRFCQQTFRTFRSGKGHLQMLQEQDSVKAKKSRKHPRKEGVILAAELENGTRLFLKFQVVSWKSEIFEETGTISEFYA